MKSNVIIDKYFCFVDKTYKNTIAIQDTTQGISRDLFRWDRRFPTPRGTDRNKLNVPDRIVIQAFNTLDVEKLGTGKIDSPVRSRSNVINTSKVNNNTDMVMKLMIQQAKINSERFNSMQERINQLSEENIMLMQIVSNDMGNSNPGHKVAKESNVDFDSATITEDEVNHFEESLDEAQFIPDEEELTRRKVTNTTATDTNATVVDTDITFDDDNTVVVVSDTTKTTVAKTTVVDTDTDDEEEIRPRKNGGKKGYSNPRDILKKE